MQIEESRKVRGGLLNIRVVLDNGGGERKPDQDQVEANSKPILQLNMNPHLWSLCGLLLAVGVTAAVGYFVSHST